MTIRNVTRLRVRENAEELGATEPDRDFLLSVAATVAVAPGDVLLSEVEGAERELEALRHAALAGEVEVRRDEVITDVYSSAFGDGLVRAAGAERCHHLQIRQFTLRGSRVLQFAAYPAPPMAHGVRLWCDPAVIWLFVAGPRRDDFWQLVRNLQPNWERLRSHHGQPLTGRIDGLLHDVYANPNPIEHLTRSGLEELTTAVGLLGRQDVVDDLVSGSVQPKVAVERTLAARRTLVRHLERVDTVLDHAHGDARSKYRSLESLAVRLIEDADRDSCLHLLAPHRHLVDGFEETRAQITATVETAAATTSLITSAAVSRLLDRSDANRRTTTAVSVAALLIALSAGFSSFAAIPRDDRLIRSFVSLGSWVGAGALSLLAVSYVLAWMATVPPARLPGWLRRYDRQIIVASAGGATVLLCLGGVSGSLLPVVGAVPLVVVFAGVRSLTSEY